MAGPYQVIASDPPWFYDRSDVQGRIEYPTMKEHELAAMRLELDEWSAQDCALFLWVTWPKLDEAFRVAEAWGFRYCSIGFVWVKTKREYQPGQLLLQCPRLEDLMYCGLGFHARGNTEPVLLFKRGSPGIFAERDIPQLIFEPIREHSRKPDEAYRRMERAYPDAKRLEMFSRTNRPGWDAFGNEVGKFEDRGAP